MAVVRSSTFTGSNGAAWTLDSGSWTHTSESGSWSGQAEQIQTNKGRASGTTTVASVRRHHAGASTFLNVEATANVVRSALTCKPGILLRATTSAASSTFYLVQLETFTGKGNTYGIIIYKCVAGTYTSLGSVSSVGGLDTTTNTLYMAARIETLGNGNARIQAKAWATGSSEPAWAPPAGDTAGAGANSNSSGLGIIDATTTVKDTAGLIGLYTEIDSAAAYQADYDDFTVNDSWAQTLGAAVITTSSTLYAGTLPGYPSTLGPVPVLSSTNTFNVPKLNLSMAAPLLATSSTLYVPRAAFNIRLPVIDSNQEPTAVLVDTFNRADSTTAWGDGGIFWSGALTSSTVGTSANKAYISGAPTTDPGGALSLSYTATYYDGTLSVDLLNVQAGSNVYLKYVNSSNYLMVYEGTGVLYLYKKLSGAVTLEGTFGTVTLGSNINIMATYKGDLVRITAYNMDTQAVVNTITYTISDSVYRSASTYAGFGAYSGAPPTRFDSWYQTWSNSTGQGKGPIAPKVNLSMASALLSTTATLLVPVVAQVASGLPAYVGTGQVAALYVGSSTATKLYVGTTQVWP